jgi:hypothetical protein
MEGVAQGPASESRVHAAVHSPRSAGSLQIVARAFEPHPILQTALLLEPVLEPALKFPTMELLRPLGVVS